jgi:thiosulfate/3-mercaptopyruvate sulfurtransferase
VQRDYIAPDAFAKLAAKNGISPDTTVIFYGDKANWWAAYALWVFRLFGHKKVKLLNGGRSKWEAEDRLYTREVPAFPEASYPAPASRLDAKIRAFKDEALQQSNARKSLIDVRSPGEFNGEVTHMPEYPQEGCSAEAISPAHAAFRGKQRRTTMALLSPPRSSTKFTLRTLE